MDDNSKSSVDDDELNQMIANLKSKQPEVSAPHMPQAPAGPAPVAPPVSNDDAAAVVQPADTASPVPVEAVAPPVPASMPNPIPPATPEPIAQPTPPSPVGPNLETIKQDAIAELRPLVDTLNLSPEDRFNTILLIIRSTDDASLLPAVHAAAKQIPDDGRRAQALLDVIKEIDFFKQ